MNQTKKLVLSALFAALICVATFTIRIPIVATNGYIHLGDALVILAGIFLSPVSAFLAAGIGSCLADLFGGYIIYIPATFFIKGIIAFFGSILFHKMIAKSQSKQIPILLCGVLDLVLVVLGYALYETVLYGMKTAVLAITGNCIQGISGILLSFLFAQILLSIPDIKRIIT